MDCVRPDRAKLWSSGECMECIWYRGYVYDEFLWHKPSGGGYMSRQASIFPCVLLENEGFKYLFMY